MNYAQGDGPLATAIGDDLAALAADIQTLADRTHDDPSVPRSVAAEAQLATIYPRNLAQRPDSLKPAAPRQFLRKTADKLDDLGRALGRSEHAQLAGEATRLRDRARDLAESEALEVRV